MLACPSCSQENPDIAKFCLACATPLAEAEPRGLEERKVVTVLFCDLAGFTALSDRADPEDVRAALRPYHSRVRHEIERFQGTVEKFIGDAVMAVFGAPLAHEDDAERAVRSGLAILEAIRDLNDSHPALNLAVRIGINTGEAVVTLAADAGRREGLVTGDVVNTASRIETIAPVGTVVVGDTTYRATRHRFEYEPVKPVKVKGKAEALAVWRAEAVRSPFGSEVEMEPGTPFLDRHDELELLRRTLSRAVRERSVQLVTLIGEPGVGKSRLAREFFRHVDAMPEVVVWRHGRCLPYGEGITYWPLRQIVKAQARILESDGPEDASTKLDAAIEAIAEDDTEREWLRGRLAPLAGLPGDEAGIGERTETFTALLRFLEAIASVHPLVLAFEDLHWADLAMLDFLEHLLDWSNDVPMLVLCSTRPELYERRPTWGGGKRNSTTISLSPLPDEHISDLVSALLSRPGGRSALPDLILQRAGGNPLYAEEFVRMLDDRGVRGDIPDPVSVQDVPFPESIQAIIAARLDTLSAERKALLQDASVVGRVFWAGAVAFMSGIGKRESAEGLHVLARRELVRPARVSSIKDEPEYSFWHGLIRDVAYAQIPRAARARKHRLAAEWIQSLAGEGVTDHAELFAYHFEQGLELARAAGDADLVSELEEPTRRALVMAGDRALPLDANRAADHYAKALDLLPPEAVERGPVLVRAGDAAAKAGRFTEAEHAYGESIKELLSRGDKRSAGGAMVELATLLWRRGETSKCRDVLGQAIDLLEREAPGPELAHAYAAQAEDKLVLGRYEEALDWSKRALTLMEMIGSKEQAPSALSVQGMSRWYLGDETGVDDVRAALEIATALGLGRDAARIQAILAELLWVTKGPVSGLEASRAGIELAERRGNAEMAMAVRSEMLGPMFDQGRWDEVLAIADQLTRWSRDTGEGYFTVIAAVYRAHVLLCQGDFREATDLAASFMPSARHIGDPQVLVEALAVAAFLEHEGGNVDAAVRLVEELEEATRAQPTWFRAKDLPELVRVCVSAERLSLAERLLQGLPVHATRHKLSLETAEAVLAEARGDHETALDAYLRSSRGWKSFGYVLEHARTTLGAGRCLARLGRLEAADRLREARSLFALLGAVPLIADTDSWLGRAPATIP